MQIMGYELLRWCALLSVLLGLSACKESPTERLQSAWSAAEDERFDTYVSHFTPDSVPLIRGLVQTASRTKRAYTYLDSPYDLAPAGDILSVDDRDQLVLVTVKADKRYTLRMLFQEGTWVIDGISLAALWAPLQGDGDG